MKYLTLVRHGNAAWKDPQASDFDRPLTRRGQGEAAALARSLKREALVPDLFLSSTAIRARQTAETLIRELELPSNCVKYEERLYLAEAEDLLRLAQSPGPRIAHVMIVGHNPGLSELARLLAPRADLPELDTATACAMAFKITEWPQLTAGAAAEARIVPRGIAIPALWP